jgi:hypothetical protein
MKLPIDFIDELPASLGIPVPPAPPWRTASLTPAQLLGHALDAGYGAPTHLLGVGTKAMPTELRQFMTLRMRSAWKLLKKRTSGYEAHAFVSGLDATDKGDASTILGSICARAAIEEWLNSQIPKQKLLRFWHYSVYTQKLVGKRVASLTWGGGKSAPDFLVCAKASADKQQWYTLEAKGTFGPRDWTEIQNGLDQAQLVYEIQVFPGGSTHKLAKAFCSQAHLHGTPPLKLMTTLVDPPPDSDALSIQLCEPLGVLTYLAKGLSQWSALTDEATAREDARFNWSRIARGLGLGTQLEIGVLQAVFRSRESIYAVLSAFEFLSVELLEPYLTRQDAEVRPTDWFSSLARIAGMQLNPNAPTEIYPGTNDLVTALVLAVQRAKLEAPVTWKGAMNQLVNARVRIPHDDRQPSTVADFARQLDSDCEGAQTVERVPDLLLPHPPNERVQVRLNGLAVWQRPEPQRREERARPVRRG